MSNREPFHGTDAYGRDYRSVLARPFDIAAMCPDGSEESAAIYCAADYHGGQWSALYALQSSGRVPDVDALDTELREAIDIADRDGWITDASAFRRLRDVIAPILSGATSTCAVCGCAITLDNEDHVSVWLDNTDDGLSYVPTLHDHYPTRGK